MAEETALARSSAPDARPGILAGLRVIELADEKGEYCGLTLAGLGAEVIKIEPPGGNPTRRIGPFYQDKEDSEGSLFFWAYNRGKRSIELDLKSEPGRAKLRSLLATADVFLEQRLPRVNSQRSVWDPTLSPRPTRP